MSSSDLEDDGFIKFSTPVEAGGKRKREEDEDNVDLPLNEITAPWLKWMSKNIDKETSNKCSHPSRIGLLHNEITSLYNIMKLSDKEKIERNNFFLTLKDLIQKFWPGVELKLFGSSAGDFAWCGGDLDMTVLGLNIEEQNEENEEESKKKLIIDSEDEEDIKLNEKNEEKKPVKSYSTCADALLDLARFLRHQMPSLTNFEPVLKARVPVLKASYLPSYEESPTISISGGIRIDICINQEGGLKTGQYLQLQSQFYPALVPLTILMKIFLVSL